MQDRNHIQKNFRNEEREVMIAPPNVKTMPMKRGANGRNVHFSGMIPYLEDEFDRPKEFARAEREMSNSMMQDKPFSQRVKQTDSFNTHRKILEEPPMAQKRVKPMTAPLMEHDKPFRPSHPPRIGHNKTLAPFPRYQEDPLKRVTRKMPVEGEEEKPKFKPPHLRNKSVPCPSIAKNMRNIKVTFPSIFRR